MQGIGDRIDRRHARCGRPVAPSPGAEGTERGTGLMTRFTDRVTRDLHQIADRSTPSSTVWESIRTRIASQTDQPTMEVIMLSPDRNDSPSEDGCWPLLRSQASHSSAATCSPRPAPTMTPFPLIPRSPFPQSPYRMRRTTRLPSRFQPRIRRRRRAVPDSPRMSRGRVRPCSRDRWQEPLRGRGRRGTVPMAQRSVADHRRVLEQERCHHHRRHRRHRRLRRGVPRTA
jgi:hypothetical protein